MEQNAAHVSRVISSVPLNAAESARPSSGSAQQETKLYTPTDGRPVGFVDVVDAVVLVVKVEVKSVVLVIEVEVEIEVEVKDWEEVVTDEEEEVVEDIKEDVVGGEEDVVEDKEDVAEDEEDVVEDEEEATEVVIVAEEFDDLSW